MKIKKMLAILCAAAMVVSSTSAFAAKPEVKLSEYAGKTMTVMVAADDREEDKVIEVAIPEGATVEEQQKLVSDAAYAAMYGNAARAARASGDFIGALGNAQIRTGARELADWGTLSRTYNRLEVDISNVATTGNASYMVLHLKNTSYTQGTDPGAQKYVSITAGYDTYVIFYSNQTTATGSVSLAQGKTIYLWGYCDAGSISCNMIAWAST